MNANEYVIADHGDNANQGTRKDPLKHVRATFDRRGAGEGVTALVTNGTYIEHWSVPDTGIEHPLSVIGMDEHVHMTLGRVNWWNHPTLPDQGGKLHFKNISFHNTIFNLRLPLAELIFENCRFIACTLNIMPGNDDANIRISGCTFTHAFAEQKEHTYQATLQAHTVSVQHCHFTRIDPAISDTPRGATALAIAAENARVVSCAFTNMQARPLAMSANGLINDCQFRDTRGVGFIGGDVQLRGVVVTRARDKRIISYTGGRSGDHVIGLDDNTTTLKTVYVLNGHASSQIGTQLHNSTPAFNRSLADAVQSLHDHSRHPTKHSPCRTLAPTPNPSRTKSRTTPANQ
jgi:hypothetical protein